MSAATVMDLISGFKGATSNSPKQAGYDLYLIGVVSVLIAIGFIMVGSASITTADRNLGSPFYYMERQGISILLGITAAYIVSRIRLVHWEKSGMALLGFSLFLLVLVLIPGIGKTVNGSTRWIPLGLMNLQVSELVKLFLIVYTAGYLVRHGTEVSQSLWGFLKPMIMVCIVCLLLLLEPDFGASVVIMMTVLVMMYLGGVRFLQFLSVITLFAVAATGVIVSSPYRLERLTTFVNPWADPFDSGFQLTQSLIAIGRGAWTGTGLGGSVQKLFYLPEAHTDFVFAVYAEETGLIGVLFILALYTFLILRTFKIGNNAEQAGNKFASYAAYGIAVWLGLQATINMGVNMGVFPTKGLTLPLMSYGGSSLVVNCIAIGLLLRISYESQLSSSQALKRTQSNKISRKRRSIKRQSASRSVGVSL